MRKRLYAIAGIVTATLAPLVAWAETITCGSGPTAATVDYKAPGGLLADIAHKECTACGQCDIADIFIVGNTITKLILGLSGSMMLLMMIYGGFLLLTSGGSSGQIDKAKKILVGSIIGIIIVFVAYTAVEFILGALGVPNAGTVFGLPFAAPEKK